MIFISKVIKIFIILFTATLVSCSDNVNQKEEKLQKKNILLFIAEDLSPDLGYNGNNLVKTPHLDALAAKGMRFEKSLVASSVCAPSRTSLITGMYPQSLGAYHMSYPEKLHPIIPDSIKTMPQIFKENGYVTANIDDGIGHGKYHWLFSYEKEDHFDLTNWKEIAEQDKPFFSMVSTPFTHRPFEEVSSRQFPLDSISIPPYYPAHQVTREDFAGYYASIETLDREFGQVMDSLKHYGFAQNTIVVFWADHGRSMVRGKYHNYMEGLHVPQIIYIPEGLSTPDGYKPKGSFHSMVSSIDLSATLLDLADILVPNYFQGEVFWNWKNGSGRKIAFSGSDRINETYFRTRSIFDGRFHYIRNYHRDFSINRASTAYRKAHNPVYHLVEILGNKGQLTPPQAQLLKPLAYEELYDLNEDPHEINNLVMDTSFLSVLEQKRSELDSIQLAINDKGMNEDSPEIKQAFGEYGKMNRKRFKEKIEQLRQEVLEKIELN